MHCFPYRGSYYILGYGEVTEDEIPGWHPRLNGHEFEQAPGDAEGQGSLACCNPWGHKESDTTEQLSSSNRWKKWMLFGYQRCVIDQVVTRQHGTSLSSSNQ